MARPSRPWFRFYVEAVSADLKIRRLDIKYRWLWVAVLAAARQSPVPGHLLVTEDDPMTAKDLVDFAAMKLTDVTKGLAEFERMGLITKGTRGEWVAVKWAQRQFEGDFSRLSISDELRAKVLARDGYACVDCGSVDDLELDHIMPVTKGGDNGEENLQVLCGSCNRKKSNRIRQSRHRESKRHDDNVTVVTQSERDTSQPPGNEITSRLCTETETEDIPTSSSVVNPRGPLQAPDDDDDPGPKKTTLDGALCILADRIRADQTAQGFPVRRVEPWTKTTVAGLRTKHDETIALLDLSQFTSPQQLADWLEPPTPQGKRDPLENTAAADKARRDREHEERCETCGDGVGWIDGPDGVMPCSACKRIAVR